MIRLLIASVLAFFMSFANAQTCLPKNVLGTGTTVRIHQSANGAALWYFCPTADKKDYTLHYKWRTSSYQGPSVETVIKEVLSQDDALTALQAIWNKYDQEDTSSTASLLNSETWLKIAPEYDALKAALPPPPTPPAIVYVVQKNGTYPDRPAYPFVDGVRGKTSTARATVGAECDASTGVVEGSSRYYAFSGNKALVALCVLK